MKNAKMNTAEHKDTKSSHIMLHNFLNWLRNTGHRHGKVWIYSTIVGIVVLSAGIFGYFSLHHTTPINKKISTTPRVPIKPNTKTSPTVEPPHPQSQWWKPSSVHPLQLQWVLAEAINVNDPVQLGQRNEHGNTLPDPDVYDIDGELNTKDTVGYLHSKGKKVICYFDAGVYETYRSDAGRFQALRPQIWGNTDKGWNNSYWLDVRRVDELRPIMQARIQMCKDKGFDAVEPDEITNWSNDPGFPISYNDQITYNRAVASWIHAAGLSAGLKGDLEQAHDLLNDFDWTLNEECFQFEECTQITNNGGPGADGQVYPGLQLFAQNNKAVWIAEYQPYDTGHWNDICTTSATQHFNTTHFDLGLPNGVGRQPCPGQW